MPSIAPPKQLVMPKQDNTAAPVHLSTAASTLMIRACPKTRAGIRHQSMPKHGNTAAPKHQSMPKQRPEQA
eukprot:scaffold281706_cov17-Tisochrysis_lutea.AAC.1